MAEISKIKNLCERAETLDIDISALAGSLEFVRLGCDIFTDAENDKRLGDILYSLQNEAKRIVIEAEEVNACACDIARTLEAVTA